MQPGRDLWWHELMAERLADLPRRAAGQRGPAVHPLHQRLDRQAQGHQAHHGRLQPLRQEDDRVGLRHPRRGRLLVHGRHRLDHRPHLRGLRPAGRRGDDPSCTKGPPTCPTEDRWWSHDREVQDHHPLHGPHRHPHLHQVGRPVGRQARPVEPAAAGQRRRGDQSRGLDVVPREDRRRPLPDRRYLVADRDGRDHDEPLAGRHRHQARQLHQAAARRSSPRSSARTASRSTPATAAGW